MVSPKFLFVLIFLYNIDFIDAASRVPFSRPGDMLRIPSVDYSMHYRLLRLNFSSEILEQLKVLLRFFPQALPFSSFFQRFALIFLHFYRFQPKMRP